MPFADREHVRNLGPRAAATLRVLAHWAWVLAAALALTDAEAAASPHVVSHRTTAAFALPAPGLVIVQTITLPVGIWSVWGKATAKNPASQSRDLLRCALRDATTATYLDQSTVEIGNPLAIVGDLPLVATVQVDSGNHVIEQQCGHDGPMSNGASIEASAQLIGMLALTGSAPGQGRQATNLTFPLSDSWSQVMSLTLPAGRYAIAAKVTGVSFQPPSGYLQCELRSDGDTRSMLVNFTANRGAVQTGLAVRASRGGVVSLWCVSHQPGAYLDPYAQLWYRRVAAFDVASGDFVCSSTSDHSPAPDLVVHELDDCDPFDGRGRVAATLEKAGKWVVLGKASMAFDSATAGTLLKCQVQSGVATFDTSEVPEGQGHSATMLATVTLPAAPTSVSEECVQGDSAELIIDHNVLFLRP